jgi:hypothetical protein
VNFDEYGRSRSNGYREREAWAVARNKGNRVAETWSNGKETIEKALRDLHNEKLPTPFEYFQKRSRLQAALQLADALLKSLRAVRPNDQKWEQTWEKAWERSR